MKNILVPTDFSDCASNTFLFAQEFSLYLKGSIKLINVVHPNITVPYPAIIDNFDDLVKEHEEQLVKFENNGTIIPRKGGSFVPRISRKVTTGFAVEEIIKESATEEIDLIVMGMTGEGDVLDKLLGSVSSMVTQSAKCPVLLIPKGIEFKDFKSMLYASDFKSSTNEILEKLVDFASSFDAKIHVAHVQAKNSSSDFKLEELILDQIATNKEKVVDVKFVTLLDDEVWHGIDVYAKEFNIDLLVLIKPERNFWNDLFHVSITKKMARLADRPLLIFPVTKLNS